MLWAGASAYSRDYDYPRMRAIADSVGAYLMSDMAHIRCASICCDESEVVFLDDFDTQSSCRCLRTLRVNKRHCPDIVS